MEFLITVFVGVMFYFWVKSKASAGSKPKSRSKTAYKLRVPPLKGEFHHWDNSAGDYSTVDAVGESFYNRALNAIMKDASEQRNGKFLKEAKAYLVLDNYNPFDSLAVAVVIERKQVGHLEANDAKDFRALLKKNGLSEEITTCDASITAGTMRGGKWFNAVSLELPHLGS